MKKYTRKRLIDMVRCGAVVDITYLNKDTRREIVREEGYCTQIGYSENRYGTNGKLYRGHKTGTLYANISRA